MNDVNFASKADDNTIYNSAESLDSIVMSLYHVTTRINKKNILVVFR